MYTIIAPYDSLKHFEMPITEYKKRLAKQLKIIELKPSKKWSIEEIKREETEQIIQKLDSLKGYKILLHIAGKHFSTMDFFQMIEKVKQHQGNCIFVIWWVYGYTDELLRSVDLLFSLSSLTFPHNMALLVLLEQLYRVETIQQGKQYHY